MRIQDVLDTMTPEQKRGALALLDHISSPLTPRVIEQLLVRKGVARHRAVLFAAALKNMHIIALVGPEGHE
mgnify:CR=1 FL=1